MKTETEIKPQRHGDTETKPKDHTGKLEYVAIGAIATDPDQPRKEFAPEKLQEMKDSILLHGILQPLIVRPFADGVGKYVLVSGERRLRGAKLAGLTFVPVIVRELGEAEIFAVQMVENLQRENLTALEEAAALQRRVSAGARPDDLAKELGISRATVFGRLTLTRLQTPVRKALIEGKVSTSVAQLIGMIPDPKKQEELLERVAADEYSGPKPFRDVQETLEDEFCVALKGAPFDLKDAELLPTEWEVGETGLKISGSQLLVPASKRARVTTSAESPPRYYVFEGLSTMDGADTKNQLLGPVPQKVAKEFARLINEHQGTLRVTRVKGGACTDCPFRTGNMPEFPEGATRPNVCTQPACYHQKCKAHWVWKAGDLAAKGKTVLDARQYKQVRSQYVEADHYEYFDKGGGGTWKEKLGKAAPEPVMAVTPKGLLPVYPRKEAVAALAKKGIKVYSNTPETKESREKEEAKRQAQEALRGKRNKLVLSQVETVAKALDQLPESKAWEALESWRQPARWGNKEFTKAKSPKARILGEGLMEAGAVDWDGGWNAKRVAVWKALGVDLIQLEEDGKEQIANGKEGKEAAKASESKSKSKSKKGKK